MSLSAMSKHPIKCLLYAPVRVLFTSNIWCILPDYVKVVYSLVFLTS